MAHCGVYYDEIRIDVRDPQLTQVYVFIRAVGDCPHTVQGWAHKTFASTKTSIEILQDWADGKEDPLMWAKQAPPN